MRTGRSLSLAIVLVLALRAAGDAAATETQAPPPAPGVGIAKARQRGPTVAGGLWRRLSVAATRLEVPGHELEALLVQHKSLQQAYKTARAAYRRDHPWTHSPRAVLTSLLAIGSGLGAATVDAAAQAGGPFEQQLPAMLAIAAAAAFRAIVQRQWIRPHKAGMEAALRAALRESAIMGSSVEAGPRLKAYAALADQQGSHRRPD